MGVLELVLNEELNSVDQAEEKYPPRLPNRNGAGGSRARLGARIQAELLPYVLMSDNAAR